MLKPLSRALNLGVSVSSKVGGNITLEVTFSAATCCGTGLAGAAGIAGAFCCGTVGVSLKSPCDGRISGTGELVKEAT